MRRKVMTGLLLTVLFFFGFFAARFVFMDSLTAPKKPLDDPGQPKQVLSNQRIGWGLGVNLNEQTPEVPKSLQDMVAKYNGIWLGNTAEKKVTLTFDMGYETEGCTPKILDALKKHNIKSVFFTVAHWQKSKPEIAKRLVKEGHILGNHTVNHRSMPMESDDEIKEEILGWEQEAMATVGKQKIKYFRPPMGEFSERTLKLTKDLGYTSVFWSVAIVDWVPMESPDKVVKDVMRLIHPGAVILLHATSADVANATDDLIVAIKKKGYKIVTLNEIVKKEPKK